MATPKQETNEEEYLDPVLKRLKPFWAEVFDAIYRGKKRGDGIMVPDERRKEIRSEAQNRMGDINKEAKSNLGWDSKDRYYENEEYAFGDMPTDMKDEREERIREERRTVMSEDDEICIYSFYVAEQIASTERGSWVSANASFSGARKYINTSEATAIAMAFMNLAHNPDWEPEKKSPSNLSKAYGDSEEKARKRYETKRQMFA